MPKIPHASFRVADYAGAIASNAVCEERVSFDPGAWLLSAINDILWGVSEARTVHETVRSA